MEAFYPGADYGCPYRHLIWVCTNPAPRGFDKCDIHEATIVLEHLRQQVPRLGPDNTAFVFHSGCLLGCQKIGTAVAVLSQHGPDLSQRTLQFFRGVTRDDVPALLDRLSQPAP